MSKGAPYQFPTTHWSSVAQAAGSDASGAVALAKFLTRYMEPLRAHLVHHRRLPPEQADDLLQGFLTEKLLQSELLGKATHEKGRFRTFLLVALDRHVSNQFRKESRRRDAGHNVSSLPDAQEMASPDPTASAVFEVAWARQILANAAQRMQDECQSSGRTDLWTVFEGRVLAPTLEGAEPVQYEQLVGQLGLPDSGTASNLLMTAKRMFARSLRRVVGEYMGEDGQIEQEIADLRDILARRRT